MLLLTLFFCLSCRVWTDSKVNYQFIFEFDTRHSLDWRQLSEVYHNRLSLPAQMYADHGRYPHFWLFCSVSSPG